LELLKSEKNSFVSDADLKYEMGSMDRQGTELDPQNFQC